MKFCVYVLPIPLFMFSYVADTVNKHKSTQAEFVQNLILLLKINKIQIFHFAPLPGQSQQDNYLTNHSYFLSLKIGLQHFTFIKGRKFCNNLTDMQPCITPIYQPQNPNFQLNWTPWPSVKCDFSNHLCVHWGKVGGQRDNKESHSIAQASAAQKTNQQKLGTVSTQQ